MGRFRAIASVRGLRLSGFPGWFVWMFVHLAFLEGFGNRLATMLRWLRAMVGRGRGEREFSVAHEGGDLSLPESVRQRRPAQPVAAGAAEPRGARRTETKTRAEGERGERAATIAPRASATAGPAARGVRRRAMPMNGFPPIADYAFLSDCEVNCLIAPDSGVEWLCLPRPDSTERLRGHARPPGRVLQVRPRRHPHPPRPALRARARWCSRRRGTPRPDGWW